MYDFLPPLRFGPLFNFLPGFLSSEISSFSQCIFKRGRERGIKATLHGPVRPSVLWHALGAGRGGVWYGCCRMQIPGRLWRISLRVDKIRCLSRCYCTCLDQREYWVNSMFYQWSLNYCSISSQHQWVLKTSSIFYLSNINHQSKARYFLFKISIERILI